ncbi:MAG: KH domain-containing protein, partial [Euryarchaeota archaeon]|nr:KH domain-containing protein [Euryarchaeota archaeon]
ITQRDIDLARALHIINKNYNIDSATFKKSFEADGFVVMIVDKGDVGKVIGKRGKFIRILRRKLNKNIRVVGETENLKEFVGELIYPARITGIDIVYPVSEDTVSRIRIEKESLDKMPAEKTKIERVLNEIRKEEIKIVFE